MKFHGHWGKSLGPYAFWNRRLDYDLRGNECFIKNSAMRVFEKNGVHGQTADEASQFIAESFSYVFLPDQGQFYVNIKSKNAEGRKWIDGKRWHELMKPLKPKEADALLKYVLNEVCAFYNSFIFRKS